MRIESALIDLVFPPPFNEPIADSTLGPFTDFPVGILQIESSGFTGLGIVPVSKVAQIIAEEVFFPLLWNCEIENSSCVERFWDLAWKRIRNMGTGVTLQVLNGIDTALWDLACKVQKIPLHRALGGTRNSIPVYATNGWINYDLSKLISELEDTVARGFSIIKMKVGVEQGRNMAEDVRRVRAVRQSLGSAVKLAVDANQCWSVEEALSFAKQIADEDILWFEEPIPARDFFGYQRLVRESPVPIAAGETLCELDEYKTFLEFRGTSIVQPYDNTVGGVTPFRRIAALAGRTSVRLTSGGFSFFSCNLVAAAPTGYVMEYAIPPLDVFSALFKQRPEIMRGEIHLLDQPGHGVLPDDAAIRMYARGAPISLRPGKVVKVAVF